MDRRGGASPAAPLLLARRLLVAALLLCSCAAVARGNGVFPVRRRFANRGRRLGDLRDHDARRHGRSLAVVDLPIGGVGHPSAGGLYFAEIALGTPSKTYHVQVDTGSDVTWVACVHCTECPDHSDLGVKLTLYDPNRSNTSSLVTCDQQFCRNVLENGGQCRPDDRCPYDLIYGDGSKTQGFFVTDYMQFKQVTGQNQTSPIKASVTFGCGTQQLGELGSSSAAVDGIIGFAQSNASIIAQLASSGKVRKMLAHCLDNVNGGGIFAIGHVVQPKVNTTPIVPDQTLYYVHMKGIDVGGEFLDIPSDTFEVGNEKGTIIDSGTTLAYLPQVAYKLLMDAIFSHQRHLYFHLVQDFLCFQYAGSLDDGFPVVSFHFEDSVTLRVYPHDYLFQATGIDTWCSGWQNAGTPSIPGGNIFLLGDMVLSNKLVIYDLENSTIGWTEYNCSSSIKMQDHKTGKVYSVTGHNISSALRLETGRFILLLIMLAMLHDMPKLLV